MALASAFLGALEAVWAFDCDDDAWDERLAAACRDVFVHLGSDRGTLVWHFGWNAKGRVEMRPSARAGLELTGTEERATSMIAASPDRAALEAFFRMAPFSGTLADAWGASANRAHVDAGSKGLGVGGGIGLLGGDANGGRQIAGLAASPVVLTDAQRAVLSGLTAHIAAATRLRRATGSRIDLDEADAVLNADGELIDRHPHAHDVEPLRDRLRDAALAQRRARDGRRLTTEETLESWRSLVDGRYTLIDCFERGGKRVALLFENPYFFKSPRALSPRQRDVVALAARGQSNRVVAQTLGLASSTVAAHLSAAMKKLGLADRTALTRYLDWEASIVVNQPLGDGLRAVELERKRTVDLGALTSAEHEVAQLAAQGATNNEIASDRGTRARTVANQLASIYSKLGINSRFELAAHVGSNH